MSRIVYLFKILSILIAVVLLSLIITHVKIDVWRVEALPTVLYQLSALIRYGFGLVNYYSTISFIRMFSLLTSSFNSELSQALTQLSSHYYDIIWGAHSLTPPSIISVLTNLYYLSFQIILAAVSVSLILFTFRNRLKYIFIIFLGLNSIIILAALQGNALIGLTSLTGNPLIFLINPVFSLTVLSYYYLEVSFTCVHVNELFKENIKLSEETLKKLANAKNANVENQYTTSEIKGVKSGRVDLFKLSAFIEKLERDNPDFSRLISGESIIPNARKLVSDFIVKSILRVSLIITLTFICVNPAPLLALIGSRALVESVEFITPEIAILLLLPLALFFPMISLIIDYRKRKREQ